MRKRKISDFHTRDRSNYVFCPGCPTESFHQSPLSKTESRTIAGNVLHVASLLAVLSSRDAYTLVGNSFGTFILCTFRDHFF